MINLESINKEVEKYRGKKEIYEPLLAYFKGNTAAQKYLELCKEKNWAFEIDHAAIRTKDVNKTSKTYLELGWEFDEKIDYPIEGWWANVYRHPMYPTLFIDQSYKADKEKKQIIKEWVSKFGEGKVHHIGVLLPEEVEIEEVIKLLEKKSVSFPGKITGEKGTRLRQIFTQAEVINGYPYTVLELTQRNRDPKTGKIYYGFVNEQADSLMKDSILIK